MFEKQCIAQANNASRLYGYGITRRFVSTESKEKVSVIITNYNNEDKISSAIQSCMNQKHKNIEVIIVDDNSKDTESLKSRISMFDSQKVKLYLSKKNNGTYSCKNYGILKASGTHITFLDSDDFFTENHIQDLLFAKRVYECDAAMSMYARYHTDSQKRMVISKISLCEPSIMIERDFAVKNLGYFNQIRFASDTEYRIRCFGMKEFKPLKVALIPKITYFAAESNGGVSTQSDTGFGSKKRDSYINYMNENIKEKLSSKIEYGQEITRIPHLEDKDYGDWIHDEDVEEFKW